MEYPKIQTIFMRDDNGLIIPTAFTKPEFEWLKDCKFRAEVLATTVSQTFTL